MMTYIVVVLIVMHRGVCRWVMHTLLWSFYRSLHLHRNLQDVHTKFQCYQLTSYSYNVRTTKQLCVKTIYVTGFAKTLNLHTSNFTILAIHILKSRKAITLELSHTIRPNKVKNMFLVLLPGQFFLSHFYFLK